MIPMWAGRFVSKQHLLKIDKLGKRQLDISPNLVILNPFETQILVWYKAIFLKEKVGKANPDFDPKFLL